MIAEELINYMVPPLKPTDDITRAKQWMDEFRVKELPVVDNNKWMGFISEESLYDSGIMCPEVGKYPLVGQNCVVAPWQHYYDVLKIQSDNQIELVAVVENESFKGVIPVADIIKELANSAMVNAPGAILILEASVNNYSLEGISKIVEMNGVSILGTNVRTNPEEPSKIEITLRLSSQDVNQISRSMEKIGHKIKSSFNTSERSFDEQERFNLLMKYLQT